MPGTSWTREDAVAELERLADETHTLAQQHRASEAHVRWLVRTLNLLEEVFGRNSRYYATMASFKWIYQGSLALTSIEDVEDPQAAIERRHHVAYLQELEAARGLLLGSSDELARSTLDAVYKGKDTGPESSTLLKVINLAEHKLRKTIRELPSDERSVQNAFEDLLIGADISYSRETDSIEYSSKTYTPDFGLSRIDLAVEIKLCQRDGREKKIIAEINDDILAYSTRYGNLLFIIYDAGLIRDMDKFAESFERYENVIVRVVKH